MDVEELYYWETTREEMLFSETFTTDINDRG